MRKSIFFQNATKILISVIIPLIIIFTIFFFEIKKHEFSEIKKVQNVTLNYRINELYFNIKNIFYMTDILKKYLSNNFDKVKEAVEALFYSNKEISDLIVLNKDKKIIFGESRLNPIIPNSVYNFNSNEKFKIINEDNQIKLQKIIKGITIDNKPFYIVVKLSIFNIFKTLSKSKNQFFILDKNGKLIYHSNYLFVLSHQDYSSIFTLLKKGIKYFQKFKLKNPLTGKYDIFTISIKPLKTYPLYLGIETNYNIIKSMLYKTSLKFIIFSILFLSLITVIIFFTSKNITKPITQFISFSKEIARGNFDAELKDIPENELKTLYNSLKNMASEIKNLISEIKQKEVKLTTLFNTIQDGIYVIDKDYNITMINDIELKYINNIKKENVIGEKCYKIFAKENSPCPNCPLPIPAGKYQHKLTYVNLNDRGFRKSDRRKMVDITFTRFYEDEYLINIHDLTELFETYEKVEEEKDKLEVTLKSIGDGVIVTDANGDIKIINRASLNILEIDEKDAVGKNIKDVFHIFDEISRKRIDDPVTIAIREKRETSIANNTVLITNRGKEKIIEDLASPIYMNGEIIGIVLVFRDVTLKKKLERELNRTRNLALVSRLAGGIAHDFNNLLTSVYGNIALAKLYINNYPEKSEQLLTKSEQTIEKAKALTSQLLTLSKGGALIKKAESIEDIIVDTVDFILTGSNIKAIYDFDENLPKVNVDKGQISQVFQNLTLNSMDAMPNGGKIYIKAEKVNLKRGEISNLEGEYVKITFKDEGIGMDKDLIEHIFEPFFTTKVEGTGLGLSICESIIRNHNGHIAVESEKNQGTTFYIYLPCAEKDNLLKSDREKEISGDNKITSKKILVIDDDEDILDFFKEALPLIGYEVDTAKNDIEAEKKFLMNDYDIIFFDLTLKGSKSGEQILNKFKSIRDNFKAVVSSGYSDKDIMRNFKNYGFDACLPKPYTISQLKNLLESL